MYLGYLQFTNAILRCYYYYSLDTPVLNSQGRKKCAMHRKKIRKQCVMVFTPPFINYPRKLSPILEKVGVVMG